MSIALQIAGAILAALAVIAMMVIWCLVTWEKRIQASNERDDTLTSTPERRYRDAGE